VGWPTVKDGVPVLDARGAVECATVSEDLVVDVLAESRRVGGQLLERGEGVRVAEAEQVAWEAGRRPYMLNTRNEENNTGFYSYLA